MITVLDIGNTSAVIVDWDGARFSGRRSVPTREFNSDMLPESGEILVSCVVPEVGEKVKSARPNAKFINSANCAIPVDFSLAEEPMSIGTDRIANCAALASLVKLPAVCVDCGTAINFEVLDSQRRFRGGAILPGRMLQRRSLNLGTALLPDIPMAKTFSTNPGLNTVDAITLGIDGGLVGAIRILLEQIRKDFPEISVVFAGGDGEFFARSFPEAMMVSTEFTLRGIVFAATGK